jgi:PAS domain S-box-containing protein
MGKGAVGISPFNETAKSDLSDDLDALRLQLQRAQAAQRASGIGIYDFDIVNDVIYWDERIRELWGVDPDEPVTYQTFTSRLHFDDIDRVQAAIEASMQPGGTGRFDANYRVIHRHDGMTRHIHATGLVSFDNDRAVRLIGTVQDVSVEVAAREDQRLLQAIVDVAPMQLYIFDLKTRRNVYLSPQTPKALGYPTPPEPRMADLLDIAMHPDDVPRVLAHHARIADGSPGPAEIEYRMRHQDGSWRWFVSHDVVYSRDDDGHPNQIVGAALDITDRIEAARYAGLVRNFADRANDMFWMADADTGRIVYANKTLADCLGLSVEEVLHRSIPLDDRYTLDDVKALLKKYVGFTTIPNLHSTFRDIHDKTMEVEIGTSAIEIDGRTYLGMVGRDVSERNALECHRELLINELNHRVKNTLATVQSVASQTLRDQCKPDVLQRLEERLLAMARSHDLLTREHWEGADLQAVARQALQPHLLGDRPPINIDGPPLRLAPNAALALSMTFHELATNAVKYGALSHNEGRVDLRWLLTGGVIALTWQEHDGPPVVTPQSTGFGSRLIQQGIAHELDGDVTLDFAPTGLICMLKLPASTVMQARE